MSCLSLACNATSKLLSSTNTSVRADWYACKMRAHSLHGCFICCPHKISLQIVTRQRKNLFTARSEALGYFEFSGSALNPRPIHGRTQNRNMYPAPGGTTISNERNAQYCACVVDGEVTTSPRSEIGLPSTSTMCVGWGGPGRSWIDIVSVVTIHAEQITP